MEIDRLSHDERLQHIALQLADHDDEGDHETCRQGAVGDERDECREQHGDGCADIGDEGTEEDDDAERYRERHAHDEQDDRDERGIGDGDQHQSLRVLREPPPGDADRLPDHLAIAGGHPAQEPGEHLGRLEQDEDEDEDRGRKRRTDAEHAADAGQHAEGDIAARGADEVLDPLVDAGELSIRDLQRALSQPRLQVGHPLVEGLGDALPLRRGLQADEGHDNADRDEEGQQAQDCRDPPRHRASEPLGEWHEPRRDEQGEEEREDQCLQRRDEEQQPPGDDSYSGKAPGIAADAPEGGRDLIGGVVRDRKGRSSGDVVLGLAGLPHIPPPRRERSPAEHPTRRTRLGCVPERRRHGTGL